LQRYRATGHLNSQNKDPAHGGEIYLITPQSVSRHTAQNEELNVGDSVATGHAASRHVATPVAALPRPPTPATVTATADDMSRYVARLELEVEQAKDDRDFLREQIDRKDKTIDALIERDRETNFLVRGLQEMLTPLLRGPRREPPVDHSS
jgi:hypothetical protein